MASSVRVVNAPLPTEGHAVRIDVGGTPVAVFRIGGELHAIDAKCTHMGGPLDQGHLDGTKVTCPWHGSVFDVRDGKLLRGPAMKPEASYKVRLEGEALILERV
jgi:nitrite reductase/ring-hydroxylating ferredoxin subunit